MIKHTVYEVPRKIEVASLDLVARVNSKKTRGFKIQREFYTRDGNKSQILLQPFFILQRLFFEVWISCCYIFLILNLSSPETVGDNEITGGDKMEGTVGMGAKMEIWKIKRRRQAGTRKITL